jgi:hypothetical protein
MFRSDDVVLVTRDGKPAGFYIPWDQPDLPIELKRELFVQLGEVVHAEREAAGVTEDEILADFAEWRAARDRRPWRQHPPLGRHRRSRPDVPRNRAFSATRRSNSSPPPDFFDGALVVVYIHAGPNPEANGAAFPTFQRRRSCANYDFRSIHFPTTGAD